MSDGEKIVLPADAEGWAAFRFKLPDGMDIEYVGSERYVRDMARITIPLITHVLPLVAEERGGLLSELHKLARDEPPVALPTSAKKPEPDPAPPLDLSDAMNTEQKRDAKRAAKLRTWYLKMDVAGGLRHSKRNHVILFIYYLTHVEMMAHATPSTLQWCFESVGAVGPNHIAGAMGAYRQTPWIAPAPKKGGKGGRSARRGVYNLTKTGERFVESMVRVK